jgi:uncharacterized protein (DUF1697 family)
MPTYVAFLRAVNVGRRKYPMAELRDVLATAGFDRVETHIQTGNVLLRTTLRSPGKVVTTLERAMREDRGFDVPVVLFTLEELADLGAEAARFAAGRRLRGHYVSLLANAPTRNGAAALEARSGPGEEVRVGSRAVHLMLVDKPYHEATTGNAEVERHLGVATTRNMTVINKLNEKWSP